MHSSNVIYLFDFNLTLKWPLCRAAFLFSHIDRKINTLINTFKLIDFLFFFFISEYILEIDPSDIEIPFFCISYRWYKTVCFGYSSDGICPTGGKIDYTQRVKGLLFRLFCVYYNIWADSYMYFLCYWWSMVIHLWTFLYAGAYHPGHFARKCLALLLLYTYW